MEGWRWWSSPSYGPDGHAAAGQVRVKVKVMAAKQGARFPAGMRDCWQQRGQNARARIPGRAAGHQHQRQTAGNSVTLFLAPSGKGISSSTTTISSASHIQ